VRNYPTWVINGQGYAGVVLSLAQLADLSKFRGASGLP
jgi:hypothetical protein